MPNEVSRIHQGAVLFAAGLCVSLTLAARWAGASSSLDGKVSKVMESSQAATFNLGMKSPGGVEVLEKQWDTGKKLAIAGIVVMGTGLALLLAGTVLLWDDEENVAGSGMLIQLASLFPINSGAVVSFIGLALQWGTLRGLGIDTSPAGHALGMAIMAAAVPVTIAMSVMFIFSSTKLKEDRDETEVKKFRIGSTVAPLAFVISLAAFAGQYFYHRRRAGKTEAGKKYLLGWAPFPSVLHDSRTGMVGLSLSWVL